MRCYSESAFSNTSILYDIKFNWRSPNIISKFNFQFRVIFLLYNIYLTFRYSVLTLLALYMTLCSCSNAPRANVFEFSKKHQLVIGPSAFVCKIPLLARALGLKAKAGRPSAARDDRVSCIQLQLVCKGWRVNVK